MISRNQTVDNLTNQFDFVRLSVLVIYGGIYLDGDVRQVGFENIARLHGWTEICHAVNMATEDNTLMRTYHELQDILFDGSWANSAVALLSALAREFSRTSTKFLSQIKRPFFLFRGGGMILVLHIR